MTLTLVHMYRCAQMPQRGFAALAPLSSLNAVAPSRLDSSSRYPLLRSASSSSGASSSAVASWPPTTSSGASARVLSLPAPQLRVQVRPAIEARRHAPSTGPPPGFHVPTQRPVPALTPAQDPLTDILPRFFRIIDWQQQRLVTLNARRRAQDEGQQQLLHHTSRTNDALAVREDNLASILDVCQSWHTRCELWLLHTPTDHNSSADFFEGLYRAVNLGDQTERQLRELEVLIEEVGDTRRIYGTSNMSGQGGAYTGIPQYFVNPIGISVDIIPGFDVCFEFGNRSCSFTFPPPSDPTPQDGAYNSHQESGNSWEAVHREIHHVITLDQAHGQHRHGVVHLGSIAGFDVYSPTVRALIREMQSLQDFRDSILFQPRSSASPSVPLPDAVVRRRSVVGKMTLLGGQVDGPQIGAHDGSTGPQWLGTERESGRLPRTVVEMTSGISHFLKPHR